MNRTPIMLSLFALAGCTDPGTGSALASADGKIRVLHQADARWKQDIAQTEMEAVLERLPEIDVIYAHNDDMAKGAAEACRQKGRDGIAIVGIDGLADIGRRYVADGVIDATFEYRTCGAEAIDLALLACSGVELPKQIKLGTRMYDKTNLAAGGAAMIRPGDIALTALRAQHAKVLTTTPEIDVIYRIGMAQCTDDEPWRVAMNRDLVAAAARYPQIEIDCRSADDDNEKQRSIVRDFIAQNFNAILISPKESLALTAVCKEAVAADIKVIVLDRELGGDAEAYSCFIGSDNHEIGKAAGVYIGSLLGSGGGTIVELQGLMSSSPAQERNAGFVEALKLQKP